MPEIDPVILQLRADVDQYLRQVKSATSTVDQQFGLQGRRARKLEAEMRRSSTSISGAVKGLAGTLAAAFTGRELMGLIDSFTRLQNQLKVAGLEGQALAAVQERLFELGGRYGVSVNSLAELYGKASQAGKELGATQDQLLALTEATSQSLLITGTSTEQASGAILGLSQALASGTVRAEEFNQINEGGLRPLLEAAAASDRFSGSVAQLRAAVIAGTVSSKELYTSILANADLLEGKAAKATLTLSGAFTALSNELIKYFGEAGQGSGITEALSGAIKSLADNLDVLIPALATIAAVIGSTMLVNMARATLAASALGAATVGAAAEMGALGAASFALQARLAGAATTMEAVTFAARGMAVAIASTGIGALIVALGYLATQAESSAAFVDRLTGSTDRLAAENERMIQVMRNAGASVDGLGSAADSAAIKIDSLTNSMSRSIGTALNLIQTLNQLGIAQTAMEIGANRLNRNRLANPDISQGPAQLGQATATALGLNDDRIAALDSEYAQLSRRLDIQISAANQKVNLNPSNPSAPASGKPGKTKTRGGSNASTGPSAADIEQRFQNELASYASQALSSMQELATNADDRAEYELRGVELARIRTLAEIAADKDYTKVQKERLSQQVEALADLERQAVERRRVAQTERDAQGLAEARYQAEQDSLHLQYDLADTQQDRKVIALQILDAEDAYLKSKLEAVIASQTATDAEKERARIALAALDAQAGARRESVDRQFEGPLARYGRNAKDVQSRVEEAAARRIDELNDTIADTMAKKLGVKDPFLRELLKIFLDQNIFGPLAEALSKGGGGGGFFGKLFSIGTAVAGAIGGSKVTGSNILKGGLKNGRASGGHVNAGALYRVNEGASPGRVEGFIPQGSGEIVPLGRMNAIRGGGGAEGQVTVRLMLADDIDARIDQRSAGVAVEIVRAATPGIVRSSVGETMRQAGRPRL